jgi:hypothetical protein
VAAKGYAVALSTATIVRFALGAILGTGLLAAVGVSVGSLIRGQLAAIVTVFPWGLVIEEFIGGLFDSTQPYLPFTTTGRWREPHSVAEPARFRSPPRPAWWRPSRCSSRASQRPRLYRRISRRTQFETDEREQTGPPPWVSDGLLSLRVRGDARSPGDLGA